MGGVPGDELQAILQGGRCNHRVGSTDGLADSFQFTLNSAGKLSRGLIEGQYLFGDDIGEERLQAGEDFCFFWKPRTISMTVMTEMVYRPKVAR